MKPKVSIVVPIYKVERYLSRCVDSIINQTYTDLEVILVNDGSPDGCGRTADEYAERDPRVKVLHKKNGGLSDARNYGMQYVTGEFTLFVDSDDWIHNRMVEELVNKSLEYQADVVQSAFYYAYDDYLLFDNRNHSREDSPILLDKKTLMMELVNNERVKNFAWGKLYRSELIQDLPFKKGVLFEDVFWAHQVMHRVETYIILHQPLYFYYQRKDSIVSNYTLRNLDILKGLKERHLFLESFYEDLVGLSYKNILRTSIVHYNLLVLNRKKDKKGQCKKEIQDYIRQHYFELKNAAENDKRLQRQLMLFMIHPYWNLLYILLVRILRKIGVIPKPVGLERLSL